MNKNRTRSAMGWLMSAVAMMILPVLFGSFSNDDQTDEVVQEGKWRFSISADRSNDLTTRALTEIEGTMLQSIWNTENDAVRVYNKTKEAFCTNFLKPSSNNAYAALEGTLEGTIEEGDELLLLLNGSILGTQFRYGIQQGTLETISGNEDCALASVTVISAKDGIVKTTTARFVNQQSIFKLAFVDENNQPVKVKDLVVSKGDGMLVKTYKPANEESQFGDIRVRCDASDVVWVALRNQSSGADTYTFTVTDEKDQQYVAMKTKGFENGKFYATTLKLYEPIEDINNVPFTMEAMEAGTISIQNDMNLSIEFAKNGGERISSASNPIEIEVTAGDKVAFFGDNARYGYNEYEIDAWVTKYTIFSNTCYCYFYGNMMSLISSTNFPTLNELTGNHTFYYLFSGNKNLYNHPTYDVVLPATTLTKECYMRMFHGCKNLTRAPKLPATKLSDHCYYDMFQATSLVEAPELPATTLENACYAGMFNYCKNLKKAPKLPAKTLTRNCYASMFCSCESLEEVPELPATKMVYACYASMFQNCKSIKKAPALPAEELASDCYNHMFSGCSSLTESPVLPATKLEKLCYWGMFEYCTSLKKVTCYAIDMSAENCIKDWLKKVAPEGTMTISPSASWGIGPSGIPEGWSINAVAAKQQWLTE